MLTALNLC